MTSYRELREKTFDVDPWIIDGFLPIGLSLFAGRPKVKKSYAVLQVARAVATGTKVWGFRAHKGKVAWFDLDGDDQLMQERTEQQDWPKSCRVDFNHDRQALGNLRTPEALARFEATITQGKYRLVVIDPFDRLFMGVNLRQADKVVTALEPIQQMALRLALAIVIIDHNRKMSEYRLQFALSQDPVEDVKDSTAKTANADNIYGLYQDHGNNKGVLAMTGRRVIERTMHMRFDSPSGKWSPTSVPDRLEAYPTLKPLVELLREGKPMTNEQLAEQLKWRPPTTLKRIRKAVDLGFVKEREKEEGRGNMYASQSL